MSGERATFAMFSPSFATMSFGVAAGASTPYQTTTFMSTPDSFIVGTPARSSERFVPVSPDWLPAGRKRAWQGPLSPMAHEHAPPILGEAGLWSLSCGCSVL